MSAFVFISYARKDGTRLAPALAEFEKAGVNIWMDNNIAAGSNFVDAIYDKIDAATKVVGFWSANAAAGKFVFREMFYADEINKLVPVRIDNIEIHRHFRSLHWLDLFRGNILDVDAMATLLSILPLGSSKPQGRAGAIVDSPAQISRRTMMATLVEEFVVELEKSAPHLNGTATLHRIISAAVINRPLLRTLAFQFHRGDKMIARIETTIDWKRANLLIDGVHGDDDQIDMLQRVRHIADQAARLWKSKAADAWTWNISFREAPKLREEIHKLEAQFNLTEAPTAAFEPDRTRIDVGRFGSLPPSLQIRVDHKPT